ncbi:MAG: hypothetical protein IJ029_07835, partial [Lachnospiraceae bacterium]|nr:hypothetical protein [Lachnospiraceae bacterium]
IAVFVILNILHGKSKKNLQKLKQQAIENQTVIVAKIKSRHHDRHTKSELEYSGRYTYTVNGKEKEYAVHSANPLADTLELYPKNSAGTKYFSAYDERQGFGFSANFIAGVAVCILILFITGYIG